MKKKLLIPVILFSFLFTTYLNSNAKEVPKTVEEPSISKKKKIQPWAVAMITILVAVTGLILVSNDKGKKK